MSAARFIVTGSEGQLGRSLVRCLDADAEKKLEVACSHAEMDIADPQAVARTLDGFSAPLTVINAAAMTAVDACESRVEEAYRINSDGPSILARACRERGYGFAHVSTDYVFDGRSEQPYRESDATAPQSVYGQSKLAGEERVHRASREFLIVRASWIFGPGRNFVAAILRQAAQRDQDGDDTPLRVVNDQCGAPTYAADLAEGLLRLVELDAGGLFHLSNSGRATWWEFARAILDESGYGRLAIEPVATDDLDLPAPRPTYSLLDCDKAGALGVALRPWQEALGAYLSSGDRPVT